MNKNSSFSTKANSLKAVLALSLAVIGFSVNASADDISGKLLLTGGVTQLEGAAGGGLTPWAVIGGYGTRDQIGASTFYTNANTQDYSLTSYGGLIGFYDRVEVSFAHQTFNTRGLGAALGVGQDFKINQDIFGIKVKILGDDVLEQDSLLPQIAIGAQYKRNEQGDVVRSLGAHDTNGTDFYISATKIILDQSLLLNLTARETRANQLGILGFGGNLNDGYKLMLEGSAAYLVTRKTAVGAEYRMKPNNLPGLKEQDWYDAFVAYAPSKNVSLTAAYAVLGTVATQDYEQGLYGSVQLGF